MNKKREATLSFDGQSIKFPILSPSLGRDVIAFETRDDTPYSFDPGFRSTASCESKITFIDGEKGILLYRGYPKAHQAERIILIFCSFDVGRNIGFITNLS